jgi:hypothetical protein
MLKTLDKTSKNTLTTNVLATGKQIASNALCNNDTPVTSVYA